MKPLYTTRWGKMFCADSLPLMRRMPGGSVDLVITSPPYALIRKKGFDTVEQGGYVVWFLPFAQEIHRILALSGSFVLNIGGAWERGRPTRSLYLYRLLLRLCDEVGFYLAQEFYWHNPIRLATPTRWVGVKRVRVKDSVEHVFWLSKTPNPKADNRRVLVPYARRTLEDTRRRELVGSNGGSIPGNLISASNVVSNNWFCKALKTAGERMHPARFPEAIPDFFIRFLTDPGDRVLDPFAGSGTTGYAAESLGRKWVAIEIDSGFAWASRLRFGGNECLRY